MKIKNILLSNKCGICFINQYINVSFFRFATILIRRKTLESGCRDRAGSMALRHGEGGANFAPHGARPRGSGPSGSNRLQSFAGGINPSSWPNGLNGGPGAGRSAAPHQTHLSPPSALSRRCANGPTAEPSRVCPASILGCRDRPPTRHRVSNHRRRPAWNGSVPGHPCA